MLNKSFVFVLLLVILLFTACSQTKQTVVEPDSSAEISTPTEQTPSTSTAQPSPTEQPTPTPTAMASPTEQPTPTAKASPTEQPTPAPTAKPTKKPTPTPEPEPKYIVEDDTIYLHTAQEKRLIYNAAPYYPNNAVCNIGKLSIDGDVLYFIETSDDGTNKKWSIIRLDQDGRHILHSITGRFGYDKYILYRDRLIYIIEGGDSCSIGDVKKDGSDSTSTIWDVFAAQHGTPYFGSIDIKRDGDKLMMEGSAYIHKSPDVWSEGHARIIIYPDLHTELVWLSGPTEYNYE